MLPRMSAHPTEPLGAQPVIGGVAFGVWAPLPGIVELKLLSGARAGLHPMRRRSDGTWVTFVEGVAPGDRYQFRLDGVERPDPRSRHQPDGVHGPSAVVDPGAFVWRATAFAAPPLGELPTYELHVGTFTAEGTFEAAAAELPGLRRLGFGAVELMPVAEFPGGRGWGYDGVDLFAPQSTYGGPEGLHRFVDAAHEAGLAVFQDVVLNHLGPEGNYLAEYGPYFSPHEKTPWGPALDFDGPASGPVREHFVHAALSWIDVYRMDGLRLDAVHAIVDHSPTFIAAEVADRVAERSRRAGRRLYVVAESDANDVRIVQAREEGGYGLDAVWSDDFHHAVHALLTGEREGYYQDFGTMAHLAGALQHGFTYEGQWSPFRGRSHGTLARGQPTDRFVVCSQNHDQIGNRARGERLSALVPDSADRLALVLTLVAPAVPLVFMGQEYGERRPFPYFTSHGDPALAKATTEGRRREFAAFAWAGPVPDPQAAETFESAKLDRSVCALPRHRGMLRLTHDLLGLRRTLPALRDTDRSHVAVEVDERHRFLRLLRGRSGERLLGLFSFAPAPTTWEGFVPEGSWEPCFDAADSRYGGPGASPGRLRGGFCSVSMPAFTARLYTEAP